MTYEDLETYLHDFFEDTSRTQRETKSCLEAIAEEAISLSETIDVAEKK